MRRRDRGRGHPEREERTDGAAGTNHPATTTTFGHTLTLTRHDLIPLSLHIAAAQQTLCGATLTLILVASTPVHKAGMARVTRR
ncbi:hypothetical protein JDM601_4093 [Mycolicibacter sinensis]|uniref:Uncharacterized protein n=1 Tax=Mycolicibacter sinensis (strain JDM601) TaxID=875328 RepID=F5YTR2_MYCSD|nr:hypothetical protein JDM601_4093 [Mycolicibacter sinensis]